MVIISHIIHAVYLHVFSDRANFLSSSRNNQKEIHTHTHTHTQMNKLTSLSSFYQRKHPGQKYVNIIFIETPTST